MSMTDRAEMMKHSNSAFQEGYDAYYEGILYEQNPYNPLVSINYQFWSEGWADAEAGDSAVDHPNGQEFSSF